MKTLKIAFSCIAAVALFAPLSALKAATLADWTFDGTPVGTVTPGTDFIYGPADSGTNAAGSAASGHHANALTAWSFTAGNPSTGKAFTSDHWAPTTDYWQFTLSTTGSQNIKIAFDTAGSGTGPNSFQLAYSTNGTTFTNFGAAYSVTTSYVNHAFDLSSITALNNAAAVFFRLIDVAPTVGGAITPGSNVGATGSNKVDNFIITGVPEPATVAGGLLAVLGLGWHQRRRLTRLVRPVIA
jgi:hypothetical protein